MSSCLPALLMTEFVDSAALLLATKLFPTTKWPRGAFQYLSQIELRKSETLLCNQTNYMSLIKTLWREEDLVLDIGSGNGKIINSVGFIVYDWSFQYKRF